MSAQPPSDARDDEPREDAQAEAAGDAQAGEARAGEPAPGPAEGEATPPPAKRRRTRRAPKAKQAGGEAGAPEDEAPPASPTAEKTPARQSRPARRAAAAGEASETPAPPVPAPRRTRPPGAASARRRVVRARARYVRTPARKARIVCVHLPGKSVAQARAILAFTPREVARDWSKLLESAVANAENNHELLEDDLIIREAYADEGPTIKRFRPRAMGRATPIRKRTSHLTITLTAHPDTTKRASKRAS
jgi:ribosomal protein L22